MELNPSIFFVWTMKSLHVLQTFVKKPFGQIAPDAEADE